MDMLSVTTQPAPGTGSDQPPNQSEPHAIPTSRIIAMVVFTLLVVLVGGVAYYLGAQDRRMVQTFHPPEKEAWRRQNKILLQSPIPTFVKTTPHQVNTAGVFISEEWSVAKSMECGADIPLPPRKDPYVVPDDPATTGQLGDEAGYWQFEERESTMFFFSREARVIFRNPESLDEYVPGEVEVFCAPNDTSKTSESLMSALESGLPDGISIVKKETTAKWGRTVYMVVFAGGFFNDNEHYIFATPDHLYLIRTVVMSRNPAIQETAQLILDSLSFPD